MTEILSPSPIIQCFVRNVSKRFPPPEREKLERFRSAVARTTSQADGRRARRCAEWAMKSARGASRSPSPLAEMRELRQEWNDFWFGLAMGAVGPRGPELTMREDIQILLVEEAVTVALQIGEKDGWGRSTWEDLLQELIDMEEEPA